MLGARPSVTVTVPDTHAQRPGVYQRAEVALKLEGLFRDQAKARQAHGQTAPGRTLVENLPEALKEIPFSGYCAPIPADHYRFPESQRTTRDAIAGLANVSGRTIDKVKAMPMCHRDDYGNYGNVSVSQ